VSDGGRVSRVGLNEALFREINERVEEVNTTLATFTNVLMIACECATLDCMERIEITPERYAQVREDPTLFMIRPGHEAPDTETVTAREEEFWVVRKNPGLAEELSRATATET
jgi:hypothetical protein